MNEYLGALHPGRPSRGLPARRRPVSPLAFGDVLESLAPTLKDG